MINIINIYHMPFNTLYGILFKKEGVLVKRYIHNEATRAAWLIYVIQYTADELGLSVIETTDLLEKHGFIEKTLHGYPAFHTQGFEYMAEFLVKELQKIQGA